MTGRISHAAPEHRDEILDILTRVVDTLHTRGIRQWNSSYPGRRTIEKDIESGNAWIYEYAGRPAAYMVLNGEQDAEYERVPWENPCSRALVVRRLFVDPDFEGRGIARALLAFSEQEAASREYTSVRLDSYSKNERAHALYQKSGYEKRGTISRDTTEYYCFEKKVSATPKTRAPRRVLCIGCVSVDIKAFSYEDGGSEAYRDGTIELVPGGVARGMAINLSHLGFSSAILSVVGKDIFGDYLRAGLQQQGIDTSLLSTSDTHKTALFSVMASRNTPASCVYCNDVLTEISAGERVRDFIRGSRIDTLVLDSNIPEAALARLYQLKEEEHLFVFQNATAPDIAHKSLPWASRVDLFACNEFEARAILGREAFPDKETADRFTELGYKTCIITFGERGVMVSSGGEIWIEKPYKPKVIVDTIGAGDAFAAGFLFGFLDDKPVRRCIQYGLACAKETLTTRETVCDFLSADMVEHYADHLTAEDGQTR